MTASRARRAPESGSAYLASVIGVRTAPGDTQLQRMPSGPHSYASCFTIMARAALLGL